MPVLLRCLGRSCLTAMLVVWTAAAQAEPVTITGGALTATGLLSDPIFILTGDGFAVAGGATHGNAGPAMCAPCVGGDVVSFESFFVGSTLGAGPAIVEGVAYASLWYAGVLHFEGATAAFPGGSGTVVVNAPFALDAVPPLESFIAGYVTQEMIGPPVFTTRLAGGGLATATFTEGPAGFFTFDSVTYAFSASPAPVPEPATLVLVGSALAAIGARRWRRRSPTGTFDPL